MATARILKLPTRLQCSACGLKVDAACDCGAPYVTPAKRAAVAVAANPGKSDRAIAAEIGVNQSTVTRVRRKSGDACASRDKRTGRDGKTYRAPQRPEPTITNPVEEINRFQRELHSFLDSFTQRFEAWHKSNPLIDSDGKGALMNALYLVSDGLARLSQKLDNR